jgi:hypothetical protein
LGSAASDEPTALQLWSEGGLGSAAGPSIDRARYRWFYLDNPQGIARVNLALCSPDPQPIGFLGIGTRRFYIQGTEVSAGALVDFVVSPKHRSVFPALLLQRQGRANALETMDVLLGLPDVKAVSICKRLESQVTFDLPRYVRVLRTQEYIERSMPRVAAAPIAFVIGAVDRLVRRLRLLLVPLTYKWTEEFDARFDRLWNRLDKSRLCIGERGREFLNWRFNRQPNHRYQTLVIGRGDDEIVMYFVCELNGETLAVKDCLNTGTPEEFTAGLLMLSRAAYRLGARSVEVQVTVTEPFKRAFAHAQFVVRSNRPFFGMVNEGFRARAQDSDWYITQADEDV